MPGAPAVPSQPPVVVQTETKAGYLTTEFWTTVVAEVLAVIQMLTGTINVSNKWVVLGMAIVGGLYNGSRGLAKQGVPYTTTKK